MRTSILALGLLLMSAPVLAQVVEHPQTIADAGSPCATLGLTQMIGDKSSIFACLKDPVTQNLLWKAQTATVPTCAAGQLLTSNGSSLQCATLQCRSASDSSLVNDVVMCNADEFAMNGGGISAYQCNDQFGFLHTTLPWGVGYGSGWGANSWGAVGPANTGSGGTYWVNDSYQQSCSTTYVTCCKFVAVGH